MKLAPTHQALLLNAIGTGMLASMLMLMLLGQWTAYLVLTVVFVVGYLGVKLVPWRHVWLLLRLLISPPATVPAADTPPSPAELRRLRRLNRALTLFLVSLLLALVATVAYYYTRIAPGATIPENVPYGLLFAWVGVGLLGLLWNVVRAPNAVAAIRATLRRYRYELRHPNAVLFDPPLRLGVLFVVEVALVMAIGYYAASIYIRSDPAQHLNGLEAEWLTSYLYQAYYSIRDEGYIALWNPWFENGEPLLANPFSFLMNPFSTIPGLLYGGEQGVLYSIIAHTMLAGVGGWFLGRVLGLSSLARVALGGLLIAKGPMHANIGAGYFQLGVAQAYMPWAIAAFLAVAYFPRKRWPPVLLAVSLALMFWAGNIWHTLPTIVSMAALALTHTLWLKRPYVDWAAIRRWAFAAGLTVALTAVTLVPIWVYQDRIGAHPPFNPATEEFDLWTLITGYWNGDHEMWGGGGTYAFKGHFFYNYVAPPELFLLLFVFIPPLWPLTYRTAQATHWRVWSVGAVLATLFTLWAAGGNWLILDIYERVELFREWRFVGRALGMASFWVVVLIAMRLDGLLRAIFQPVFTRTWRRTLLLLGPQLGLLAAATVLLFPYLNDGNERWEHFGWTIDPRYRDRACADWLRARLPDEQLSVYRPSYDATTAFLDNRIRMMPIEADFELLPDPGTLGADDLRQLPPRYAFGWTEPEHIRLDALGYVPWEESPYISELLGYGVPNDMPCVWRQEDAYAYTFATPVAYLRLFQRLNPDYTYPVTVTHRDNDDIHLHFTPPGELDYVVVAQELAYPGWQATLNGERVAYEPVGGLLGVVVPAEAGPSTVRFAFRPQLTYQMSAVTLVTILGVMLYLLRVDVVLRRIFARGQHP